MISGSPDKQYMLRAAEGNGNKIYLERHETMNYREMLKDKKRIVVKVGSSSLIHKETNKLNLRKLEVLVRELSDLHNQGKDVVLVTSGAVAVGASALGLHEKAGRT